MSLNGKNKQCNDNLSPFTLDKNICESALNEKNDKSEYIIIDIDLVVSNKFQPRKYFNEGCLQELSKSILISGLIQPIIVRKSRGSNLYEIIAGERRWRASKMANLKKISVIIKNIDDKSSLELSIIENIQRENINCIEEGEAFQRLINDFNYRHEDLSNIICKSRSYITNLLRVLKLPDSIKEMIKDNLLSLGHAKAIVNAEKKESIAQLIIKKGLNVRQTENLIKNNKNNIMKMNTIKNNEDLLLIEKKISENLGMNVKIRDKNNNGTVLINFKTLDELNVLLRKLSYNV